MLFDGKFMSPGTMQIIRNSLQSNVVKRCFVANLCRQQQCK